VYVNAATPGDAGFVVDCTAATAVAALIPTHTASPYPLNTVLGVAQRGDGQVSVAGDTNVLVNVPASLTAKTLEKFGYLFYRKVSNTGALGEGEWDQYGGYAELA
jgi:hypothetical protein